LALVKVSNVRWSTLVLIVLLVLVQLQLWFGSGGRPYVVSLEQQLAAQREVNVNARERNERLAAEVMDLKQGLEMVEEKARMDMGMVKPGEVMVNTKPATK
jgi:cell division protein FtsB